MGQKYGEYTENPGIYGFDVSKRSPTLTKDGSLHSFELNWWSKPDESRRVKHIGIVDAKEIFDELKTHLETYRLLPDGYFLYSGESSGESLEFEEALCIPNFNSSEEIYLSISLVCQNSDSKWHFQSSVTGRTLGETADDYFRMFRIAAECSLMLNGYGFSYGRDNVGIVSAGKEATAVTNLVELDLRGCLEPEAEVLLSSALDEFTGIPCTTIQAITCHGRDDYAAQNIEIPSGVFRSIVREAVEKVGTLEELISGMDPPSGYEVRLLTQMRDGRFVFFVIPERVNGLRDYETQGGSACGNKEQIMVEIFTNWEPVEEPGNKMER